MWTVAKSGVKLQYKLAHVRYTTRSVNTARMRDNLTSVIGRYDILPIAAFCALSCTNAHGVYIFTLAMASEVVE